MEYIKNLLKYIFLFLVGGGIYYLIEITWDGTSDITMMICGGIAFVLIGLINEKIPWNLPIYIQGLIGGLLIITPLEYLFGVLFNSDYSIWDYRNIPFNINGHICLGFSILWCLISLIAIVLDDVIRWKFFKEEKPHYTL